MGLFNLNCIFSECGAIILRVDGLRSQVELIEILQGISEEEAWADIEENNL